MTPTTNELRDDPQQMAIKNAERSLMINGGWHRYCDALTFSMPEWHATSWMHATDEQRIAALKKVGAWTE